MTKNEYNQMITNLTNIFNKETDRCNKIFNTLIKLLPDFITEIPRIDIDNDNYSITLYRPKNYPTISLKLKYKINRTNKIDIELPRNMYDGSPIWIIYENDRELCTPWDLENLWENPDVLTLMGFVTDFYIKEIDIHINKIYNEIDTN